MDPFPSIPYLLWFCRSMLYPQSCSFLCIEESQLKFLLIWISDLDICKPLHTTFIFFWTFPILCCPSCDGRSKATHSIQDVSYHNSLVYFVLFLSQSSPALWFAFLAAVEHWAGVFVKLIPGSYSWVVVPRTEPIFSHVNLGMFFLTYVTLHLRTMNFTCHFTFQ